MPDDEYGVAEAIAKGRTDEVLALTASLGTNRALDGSEHTNEAIAVARKRWGDKPQEVMVALKFALRQNKQGAATNDELHAALIDVGSELNITLAALAQLWSEVFQTPGQLWPEGQHAATRARVQRRAGSGSPPITTLLI